MIKVLSFIRLTECVQLMLINKPFVDLTATKMRSNFIYSKLKQRISFSLRFSFYYYYYYYFVFMNAYVFTTINCVYYANDMETILITAAMNKKIKQKTKTNFILEIFSMGVKFSFQIIKKKKTHRNNNQ